MIIGVLFVGSSLSSNSSYFIKKKINVK
jgi:hypothetical protein